LAARDLLVIDFRYHLVSIIAIFLALAIGIVLGTTTINQTVLRNIQSEVKRLSHDKSAQRQQIATLQSGSKAQQAYIAGTEPLLETGTLAGQRVVVIIAAGTPGKVHTGLLDALKRAGAVVSNDIGLANSFTDPKQVNTLDDLATRLVVPGNVPAKATGTSLAAAELAAVLVTKPGSRPPSQDAIQTTLAGFQQGSFLSVNGTPGGPATLAVVLVPLAPSTPDDSTTAAGTVLADLAARFGSQAAATVVAGPGAATHGGMLATVRSDRAVTSVASSVDTVDSPAGRVAAVLALRSALAGRRGAFGFGPGASALLPPGPSPTASPTK
jgi:Copper transport outer membrane protein, MctB